MIANDFFQEIEHEAVPWRQYTLHVPLFYQDFMFLNVSLMAPTEKVLKILPSTRMKPYRITPWHSAVTITAYNYRATDIGPYNEISIGVPITLDEPTPLFTGTLRKVPDNLLNYIHQLPVTTEIAREVGAEFAGYPKFIADIEWDEDDQWVTCSLKEEETDILTINGRKIAFSQTPRRIVQPLTFRQGYILRSEFVISERNMGVSKNGNDFQLELGKHPIAEALKNLELGRVLSYGYCPQAQGILTPVFESFHR